MSERRVLRFADNAALTEQVEEALRRLVNSFVHAFEGQDVSCTLSISIGDYTRGGGGKRHLPELHHLHQSFPGCRPEFADWQSSHSDGSPRNHGLEPHTDY